MPFLRSISQEEQHEFSSWSQGEYADTNSLAVLKSNGIAIRWGSGVSRISDSLNSGGIVQLYGNSLGLKYDNSLVSFDYNEIANGLQNVRKVFSTESSFAALRFDGSVVTWNKSGVLENTGWDSSSVEEHLNTSVIDIFSTRAAFAARRASASASCKAV